MESYHQELLMMLARQAEPAEFLLRTLSDSVELCAVAEGVNHVLYTFPFPDTRRPPSAFWAPIEARLATVSEVYRQQRQDQLVAPHSLAGVSELPGAYL